MEIQATVDQLLDVGNQQFRGRYLFAGSESTLQPFANSGKFVAFAGNNTSLRTYANQGLLFDTNVPGQELFGAVSAEVQGVDLNPVLTSDTRLADLRNGQGITKGNLPDFRRIDIEHRLARQRGDGGGREATDRSESAVGKNSDRHDRSSGTARRDRRGGGRELHDP